MKEKNYELLGKISNLQDQIKKLQSQVENQNNKFKMILKYAEKYLTKFEETQIKSIINNKKGLY